MEALRKKKCEPCENDGSPLSIEVTYQLLHQVTGWSLSKDSTSIERSFKFENFADALEFTNRIGDIAEDEGHHPDMKLGWGYVECLLTTHSMGGLSENDFIVAAKIDALLE